MEKEKNSGDAFKHGGFLPDVPGLSGGCKMPIKHAEELLELFSVFTGDRTYEEMVPYVRKEQEKGK